MARGNQRDSAWMTRLGLVTMCMAVAIMLFFAVNAYNTASADAARSVNDPLLVGTSASTMPPMDSMMMTNPSGGSNSATPMPTMLAMAGMVDPSATAPVLATESPISTMAGISGMNGSATPLAPMANMTPMAGIEVDSCTNLPVNAADQAAVAKLETDVKTQAARFVDINVAINEGYQQTTAYPIPGTHGKWGPAHFLNTKYTVTDIAQGTPINPDKPGALVYFRMPSGQMMLLGEMFIAPIGKGPCLGGGLTMWHSHSNLCFKNGTQQVVGVTNSQDQCAPGATNHQTADMMHVWVFDNPDGALLPGQFVRVRHPLFVIGLAVSRWMANGVQFFRGRRRQRFVALNPGRRQTAREGAA